MGKKGKRKAEASSSQDPQKGIKIETPSTELPMINYEDMPLNHKKKLYINDDCGSLNKYVEVIAWLRTMSTFDGSVFEGIPNLNYSGTGHPLVEIEVITPGNNSAKFIISKMTLYVVAFSASKIWFQFWCEYDIKDFRLLVDFNGSYTTKPWKFVGPYCMIEAIDTLANPSLNASDMRPYVEACEVFYVHLSEAARLYAIESVICKTLTPPQAGEFDGRTYEDEESATLVDEKGGVIQATEDVYALVAGDGPVKFDLAVKTPDFIESLLKKFSNLSKVWYVFALSGRKLFEMAPGDVSRFHMRSVKSLRCTLGVLCNINLDKVLQEWKRKSATHEIITPEVYKEWNEKFASFKSRKKSCCLSKMNVIQG